MYPFGKCLLLVGFRPGVGWGRRKVAQCAQRLVGRGGGGAVCLLKCRVDLLAVNIDAPGRLDSDPNLVTPDFKNRDHDVVPNHDALIRCPGQN